MTSPSSTAPSSTAPSSTAPSSTAPSSTAPSSTAPSPAASRLAAPGAELPAPPPSERSALASHPSTHLIEPLHLAINLQQAWRSGRIRVLEAVLLPAGVMWGVQMVAGVRTAALATVGLLLLVSARRFLNERSLPSMAALALLGAAVRGVAVWLTGTWAAWFLPVALSSLLLGLAFLATSSSSRPLVVRLAAEVGVLPEATARHPRLRAAFLAVSLVWALTLVSQSVLTVLSVLLVSSHLVLVVRSLGVWALFGLAVLASVRLFLTRAAANGVRVRLVLR